jgi:hypothetical protein
VSQAFFECVHSSRRPANHRRDGAALIRAIGVRFEVAILNIHPFQWIRSSEAIRFRMSIELGRLESRRVQLQLQFLKTWMKI